MNYWQFKKDIAERPWNYNADALSFYRTHPFLGYCANKAAVAVGKRLSQGARVSPQAQRRAVLSEMEERSRQQCGEFIPPDIAEPLARMREITEAHEEAIVELRNTIAEAEASIADTTAHLARIAARATGFDDNDGSFGKDMNDPDKWTKHREKLCVDLDVARKELAIELGEQDAPEAWQGAVFERITAHRAWKRDVAEHGPKPPPGLAERIAKSNRKVIGRAAEVAAQGPAAVEAERMRHREGLRISFIDPADAVAHKEKLAAERRAWTKLTAWAAEENAVWLDHVPASKRLDCLVVEFKRIKEDDCTPDEAVEFMELSRQSVEQAEKDIAVIEAHLADLAAGRTTPGFDPIALVGFALEDDPGEWKRYLEVLRSGLASERIAISRSQ